MTHNPSQRGFALLAALCCLALATTMTAAFYEGIHRALERQQRERWRLEAVYLAEAGVEKAVASLSTGGDYKGEQGTPLGPQADHARVFSVKISTGPAPGTLVVRSEGAVQNGPAMIGSARIEATVTRGPGSVFRVTSWRETAK